MVIQVKGKVRGKLQVPASADKEELERLALASDVAEKWLEGAAPRRVIVIPGKLVNINAYHQPGVEAGKKAAAAILELQGRVEAILADGVARSADEIRLALGDGTDESIFWILRHLTGNQRGFSAQGDWSQPASMRFSKG